MTSTLADLQRRNIEQMGTLPTDTDSRISVLTEASEKVSTGTSNPSRKGASTSATRKARADANKGLRQEPSVENLDFLATVNATLLSREPLIGGIKATVDMSPELSTRAKRYLADHRGQSTRQVLIALFDAFLKAKGY